LKIQDLNTNKS